VLQPIVLAAGSSSRMGSPKAVLPDLDGRPFIARIVRTLRAAGLPEVLVITGPHHTAIAEAIERDGLSASVRLVLNPDPSRGQLSSIWAALEACDRSVEGVLITLVDVPLVASSTVQAVVDAWRDKRPPVVRPIVGGRRGHPVVFDRSTFDELKAAPLTEGARVVVRAHWPESVDVPVNDAGCLVDVDTPADYARLRAHE
jgi:molybdenum cofactor cytidylyltransferase